MEVTCKGSRDQPVPAQNAPVNRGGDNVGDQRKEIAAPPTEEDRRMGR